MSNINNEDEWCIDQSYIDDIIITSDQDYNAYDTDQKYSASI